MKLSRKILISVAAAVVLAPVILWYAAVPNSAIPAIIASHAAGHGAEVRMSNFKKGPLLSFSADSVTVGYPGGSVLTLKRVRGRVNLLGLLELRLLVHFRAKLSGGAMSGQYAYSLFSGRGRLRAKVRGARLSGFQIIKGADGECMAQIEFFSGGPGRISGSLMFSANDLRNFPYGFKTANGLVNITPDGLGIKSISLDSGQMYADVKGIVRGWTYNIRMDVSMEKGTAGEGTGQNPVQTLLSPYRVSPGYYVIPLSGKFHF